MCSARSRPPTLTPPRTSPKLHQLASHSDPTALKELLSTGVNINTLDSLGNAPLHYACASPSASSSRLSVLLAPRDVDADIFSETGDTPLLLACKYGHSAMIRALLFSGRVIPTYTEDTMHVRAVDFCLNSECEAVFEEYDTEIAEFFDAVRAQDCKVVAEKLETVSVNVTQTVEYEGTEGSESYECCALDIALGSEENEEMVELILSYGPVFDPDQLQNLTGDTPTEYLISLRIAQCRLDREVLILELLKNARELKVEIEFLTQNFMIPFVPLSLKMIKNSVLRTKVCDLFAGLSMIEIVNGTILTALEKLIPSKGPFDQAQVVDLFDVRNLRYESMRTFVLRETLLGSQLSAERDYSAFAAWIKAQEKKLRCRDFPFLDRIRKIRARPVEYLSFVGNLLKSTQEDYEPELYGKITSVLVAAKKSWDRIEDRARRAKNTFDLAHVSKILKTKYGIGAVAESKKRRYVVHEIGLRILWCEQRRAWKKQVLDVFVFSDCFALCETSRRWKRFGLQDRTKVVFVVGRDTLRITVYMTGEGEGEGEGEQTNASTHDVLLRLESPRKWLTALKWEFSSYRYLSRVLVIDHCDEVPMTKSFLNIGVHKNQLLKLKELELGRTRNKLSKCLDSKARLEGRIDMIQGEYETLRVRMGERTEGGVVGEEEFGEFYGEEWGEEDGEYFEEEGECASTSEGTGGAEQDPDMANPAGAGAADGDAEDGASRPKRPSPSILSARRMSMLGLDLDLAVEDDDGTESPVIPRLAFRDMMLEIAALQKDLNG